MTRQASAVHGQSPGNSDNWQQWAACGDADPETFYGDDSRHAGRPQPWEQAAIRICNRCPVRASCLDEALMWPEPAQHGVQGGMTAGQRRELLKSRDQQPVSDDTDVVDISDLPADVDYRSVQALLLNHRAPGAGSAERRWAAVALDRGGWPRADIARHLGVAVSTVSSWLSEIRRTQMGAVA